MALAQTLGITKEQLEEFGEGLFFGTYIKDFDRDDLLALACRYVNLDEDRRKAERKEISRPDNWFNKLRKRT